MLLYEGPSTLDGRPIVVIATDRTRNEKTGSMVQVWILRADVAPHEAIKTGDDASICGDCKHRGTAGKGRSCYVIVSKAPFNIWKKYRRGGYVDATQEAAPLAGQTVRLGAYGDPAAIPAPVLERIMSGVVRWTGYTHQWRKRVDLAWYAMASVESFAEMTEAQALGFRTFRVSPDGSAMPSEVVCPSVTHGTQCAHCRLCTGVESAAKNITIQAHGAGKKYLAVIQ